jgi:alkanesulfonate monooxygenase SsuD/methylene tetrahydromethanopterin reductase-like flavin-dependent oxidoreductase (luciferase family)
MSIALILASRGVTFNLATAPQLVELAEIADRSGAIDGIWVGDSLIGNPRVESISLLSAIAARTKRVRLGAACMASIALRDPVLLAMQWASLDMLSEGRATLIACAGNTGPRAAIEARHYNMSHAKERYSRMLESMEVMRRLWTEEAVDFAGEYYRLEGVPLGIKPVQRPRPPIWLAADVGTEAALRRVAKHAEGWMTSVVPPEEFQSRWRKIEQYAPEYGRDPSKMGNVLYFNVHVTEKRDEAYAESKRFLAAYYGREWPDDVLTYWLACGTPEECAAHLQRWQDAGLKQIAVRLTSWDQFGQLKRFVEEVVPRLRR